MAREQAVNDWTRILRHLCPDGGMTMGRGLFPDNEIAQTIKSTILLPVGSVVGAFGAAGKMSLTFDDGPDPDVTPAMLDVLKRHDAKATFFMLTEHAAARQALVRRVLDEGHEIGLHFDRHDRIPELPPATAFRRMRQAKRDLADLAGPISLFRPPYGNQNYLTYVMARTVGLKVVCWNRYTLDTVGPTPEEAARPAIEHLRGGDIILMHDGLELGPEEPRPTVDRAQVADLLLRAASERGLKSVTVGALLAQCKPQRSHWFRRLS
jgi:peptidoglycan/xylan/chitin deacetylase (PgdA/CDA1 family)